MRFLPPLLVLGGALALRQPGVYHADRQIEWLREHGGFFSDKIQFQLFNQSDTDSPMGIFAVEDIDEKETIMVIPHDCLLTSGGSYDMCDTVQNLVKERRLGNESKFAPYVDYVFDDKHKGQLPSAWSEDGQRLLDTILGGYLPPYEAFSSVSFEEACGGSGDPLEEEAYLSVLRRSWEDILVPVYDMINHRNGKWYNVDSNSAHEGNDITIFTSRQVKADEQLYLSYNECIDCEGDALTYGLPSIFLDYGFVEQYPRRWIFEMQDGDNMVFELDQDDETNERAFTWLSEKPSVYEFQFLEGELGRLKTLRDYVTFQSQRLKSKHEREVSVEYYEALVTALEYALLYGPTDATEDCSTDEMTI